MKCSVHNSEAIGICAYCERAMCGQCDKLSGPRMACSESCASALAYADKAMELILKKSVQNARASAFYSYLCAALSAGAAVGAWFYLPSPFLIWFTAACSVVFVVAGYFYMRSGR
ncbi:MAG TPA: hypothetical protein VMH30_05220 [Verrucomicrobiae bacterium]|nr:hypothetical protein [Verrucomicrobiae bacterium]